MKNELYKSLESEQNYLTIPLNTLKLMDHWHSAIDKVLQPR